MTKKWYETLKEGDEVVVYHSVSSNPYIAKVEGFFKGNPVIEGRICFPNAPDDDAIPNKLKDESFYSKSPISVVELKEDERIKIERTALINKLQDLSNDNYNNLDRYCNDDLKELIAFHEKKNKLDKEANS